MAKSTQNDLKVNTDATKTAGMKAGRCSLTNVEETLMNTTNLNSIITRLLNTFMVEIRKEFSCSGLKYEANNFNLHFVNGVMGRHRCSFDLQIGENSYGGICLSSEKSFMKSDISNIENKLAGLLMNLHELLRHSDIAAKNKSSNSDFNGESLLTKQALHNQAKLA